MLGLRRNYTRFRTLYFTPHCFAAPRCLFMVKLRQHFRAAFYAWLIWFSIILFVQFCSLLLFSYKRRYISQFLSGFLVIFGYLGISFFDAFKGAFSFRLVCSYCLVAFCRVLVASLLIFYGHGVGIHSGFVCWRICGPSVLFLFIRWAVHALIVVFGEA